MTSDNNTGCGKVALVLGAIASLIAIFVFLTGKPSLPEFLGGSRTEQVQRAPIATQQLSQTPKATLTPTARPTDTPLPRPSPTKTLIPSPTPLPDTLLGTVLEVGQTWRQKGIEIQLTKTWLYPEGLNVQFRMRNIEASDKAVRYSLDNFSAVDNRGNRVPVGYNICGGCFYFTQDCPPRTEVLPTLGSISFENSCGGYWSDVLALPFDTGNPSITEVVISVSGISSITEARWRISIYH